MYCVNKIYITQYKICPQSFIDISKSATLHILFTTLSLHLHLFVRGPTNIHRGINTFSRIGKCANPLLLFPVSPLIWGLTNRLRSATPPDWGRTEQTGDGHGRLRTRVTKPTSWALISSQNSNKISKNWGSGNFGGGHKIYFQKDVGYLIWDIWDVRRNIK